MTTSRKPKQAIILKPGERGKLERLAAGQGVAAVRAAIVLASAGGETDAAIARRLGVKAAEVAKWRRAFLYVRVDGLTKEPEPRRVRSADSPGQVLVRCERALTALAHDLALVERAAVWPASSAKDLAGSLAVLPADTRAGLAACKVLWLAGRRVEPELAFELLDARGDAEAELARFRDEVEEFDREAVVPAACWRLIDALDQRRRIEDGPVTLPAVRPPRPEPVPTLPAARPTEIPAHLIRRVAPAPAPDEDETQFAHLAKPDEDESG